MTVKELKFSIDIKADILIIDIREPYECENGSISDFNIPLAEFMSRINEIPKEKTVILYCNSGKRSQSLKYMIEKIHAFSNLNHLEGGYQKWEEELALL